MTTLHNNHIDGNPLLSPFDSTPHGTPPFHLIKTEHFEPAVDWAIERGLGQIDAITSCTDSPTFENTILALERAGRDLDRVMGVLDPLESAMSDDALMEVVGKVTPRLADYSTCISLNEKLWQRIKAVHDYHQSHPGLLDGEDAMLLGRTYESFARSGALLTGDDRVRYGELRRRLSDLTTRFGQNALRELNATNMWLTAADLDGLTQRDVDDAAEAARAHGREGEYLFTLDAPVYMGFMKHSSRRDLRERMWRLYTGRNTRGEWDNVPVLTEIAVLRLEMARLLGFETYAHYKLDHSMAKNPSRVNALLEDLRKAYTPALKTEMQRLRDFASEREGHPIELHPWDYSYYADKLRTSLHDYDEEKLRPYFELEAVTRGVFSLATRLYGITFRHDTSIPVYHPDVKAWEVSDADGSYLGVLFTDFFPRQGKRAGAWMTEFKPQEVLADGTDSRPHVTIVMNFTKPQPGGGPSLLTPGEVETFLHEFGHALHGLLSRVRHASLSGTNVLRDFVELPSQFNENFMRERAFLDTFARHYLTGEPLPDSLLGSMIDSSRFGAAYACFRQLSFGMLDMAWHSIAEPVAADEAAGFENAAVGPVAVFAPEPGSMVSPTFSHIFAGGYAAGYYGYKWAEVLDADAFELFRHRGVFDRETAASFRHNILERGGSAEPGDLYRCFRGGDPKVDALLARDGIVR